MNEIYFMDQLRATLATQCHGKRVHMTLFTFLMDLGITQAYAVYQKISEDKGEKTASFFTFKRKLCESLITPLVNIHPRGSQLELLMRRTCYLRTCHAEKTIVSLKILAAS
jgi:hypothetical protein